MKSIGIVIPAYKEAEKILSFIKKIRKQINFLIIIVMTPQI